MIKNKRIKKNIEAMKFELSKGQEKTPLLTPFHGSKGDGSAEAGVWSKVGGTAPWSIGK